MFLCFCVCASVRLCATAAADQAVAAMRGSWHLQLAWRAPRAHVVQHHRRRLCPICPWVGQAVRAIGGAIHELRGPPPPHPGSPANAAEDWGGPRLRRTIQARLCMATKRELRHHVNQSDPTAVEQWLGGSAKQLTSGSIAWATSRASFVAWRKAKYRPRTHLRSRVVVEVGAFWAGRVQAKPT